MFVVLFNCVSFCSTRIPIISNHAHRSQNPDDRDDDEEFESGRAGRPGARPAEPPRSGARPATQAELDNSRKPDGSLRWQKHLKKTKICKFWLERNGDCPYGANCNFAHGEAEIERPRPPSPEFHARNGQYNAAAPPPGAFAGSTPRADGFQRRGGRADLAEVIFGLGGAL